MKKILALSLALIMALSLCVSLAPTEDAKAWMTVNGQNVIPDSVCHIPCYKCHSTNTMCIENYSIYYNTPRYWSWSHFGYVYDYCVEHIEYRECSACGYSATTDSTTVLGTYPYEEPASPPAPGNGGMSGIRG